MDFKISALFSLVCLSYMFYSVLGLRRPRGVSLEKASFYQEGQYFQCLSDGKSISFDYVNDDYCDCEDGSDEPGTSACANGLFFCENKGYNGRYIKSSRVNDGICDCCDGSDEFEGIVSCENTCMEKHKREMAQQEELRRNHAEGIKINREYQQQGKRTRDEKLSEMSELQKQNSILTVEKETAEAAKNEVEEREKAAIDEHKKAWELVKQELQKEKDAKAAAAAFSALDVNQDGSVDYPEVMNHKEFDIDSDGTVSEEEAKEYLEDSEQVDLASFSEKIWPNIKEIFKLEEEKLEQPGGEADGGDGLPEATGDEKQDPAVAKDVPVEVVEGGSPDDGQQEKMSTDDDDAGEVDYEDDEDDEDEDERDEDSAYDISDKKSEADLPEEEKEPEYSEETNLLVAAANEARNKFNEADRKLKDNEREISEIKKYLELDLGPNQEFAALKGQCFEFTDREYTYRLCPFDKTTQKSKNGGIETSLGTWGKWHGPDEDKYDAMKYENGQGCWNGPSRSTHVNLHCGSTNEVTSASEPSRCEYQFEFTTPARCQELKPMEMKDIHEEL